MIKFDDAITYNHLLASYFHCRKGKSFRAATVQYHMNYMVNIGKLLNQLRSGTYEIKSLYSFVIYEPKKRNITANQFEDKIVQRVVCKYALEPAIQPLLIYDNYASQPGKGNHLALKRLEKFMAAYAKSVNWENRGWVLVCDIRKFFYTIDREVCFELVDKLNIDDRLKDLVYKQIWAYESRFNEYTDDPNKGLCIGFQTSQWLAVYYMSGLDHFIKEKLHIKYYGRYMDDLYLIHESREYLEYCYTEIRKYVETKLKLELNEKSHIHPFSQGICFLGYHCTYNPETHQVETRIRSKSVQKLKKRTRLHVDLIAKGKITTDNALDSIQSWHSYATHGETEKSANALIEARNMIQPLAYDWMLYQEELEDLTKVDAEGFYILKYRQGFVDHNGFQKMIPHIETMEDYRDRQTKLDVLSNPKEYFEKNIEALQHATTIKPVKHNTKPPKKEIAKDSLNRTILDIVYPEDIIINIPKKKKKSNKKLWEDLDMYRDDDGFVELKKRK